MVPGIIIQTERNSLVLRRTFKIKGISKIKIMFLSYNSSRKAYYVVLGINGSFRKESFNDE